MSSTFIDVHVLQTVPPSNLNRDDTGSPKTAYYGGVRRARVSSQAWKRATRTAFDGLLDPASLGVRTKRVVDLVAEEVRRRSPEVDLASAEQHASAVIEATGVKLEKPRRAKKNLGDVPDEAAQSGYLVFWSRRQVDQLAEMALGSFAGSGIDKKAAKAAAGSAHSVDLSLFGRMVADDKELSVDASAQVAHALSVHAVDNEYDYFTAVDDRSPADSAGAGMIGTVEFNSSTLYRYATVDVDGLRRNLEGTGGATDATAQAVRAFLRAFITSMPTGKQNTFANRTLPDAVLVQVRTGQPVNLVGAFEEAVVAGDGTSRLRVATERLVEYSRAVDQAFGATPSAAYVVQVGAATAALAELGQAVTLDELVEAVGAAVTPVGMA